MTTIILRTIIRAPREICFDLARSVDAHLRTSAHTQERAIGGRTSGLLQLGDTVTWEATHLRTRQRFSAQITELGWPTSFVDEMVSGAFHAFCHVHEFRTVQEGTLMIDTVRYVVPLGVLGQVADALLLKRHMQIFLEHRAAGLKDLAETAGARSPHAQGR
jgi:ligand-binding SRPBCC domain-containing protein